MSSTLDGQELFDQQQMEIQLESIRRDAIERSVPGLDGVMSVDLGSRSRKIKQKGSLRAKSFSQMDEKIDAISAYIDGNTHTLVTSRGEIIDHLRMDTFKVNKERTSGNGICCDYEIVYTQLKV
jgi:hypothetical protein